jgi:hypothetical protein
MLKKYAFVKYTKKGALIPGSLVITTGYPKETANGVWKEVPMELFCCEPITTTSTTTTTTTAAPIPLRMLFSDINGVNVVIGDSANVSDWNTYFDLPAYGNPYTSVIVTENEVKLYGGSNVIIKEALFDQADEVGAFFLEIEDTNTVVEIENGAFGYNNNVGCQNLESASFGSVTVIGENVFSYCVVLSSISFPILTTLGVSCFSNCYVLNSINLPLVTFIGNLSFTECSGLTSITLPSVITVDDLAFYDCTSLLNVSFPVATTIGSGSFQFCYAITTMSFPSCINLGATVEDDAIFALISGNTITLTVPSALMTCFAGNPDGDIQLLQDFNTVTIVTV